MGLREGWAEIPPDELLRRWEAGERPLMVDVRTAPEVFAYHIPGARWIPLNEIGERFEELNPEEQVIFICEHGVRSVYACRFLQEKGFGSLLNMTGGMSCWNGPIERGLPVPPTDEGANE